MIVILSLLLRCFYRHGYHCCLVYCLFPICLLIVWFVYYLPHLFIICLCVLFAYYLCAYCLLIICVLIVCLFIVHHD